MKISKSLVLIVVATFALVACEEKNNIPNPGSDNPQFVSPGLDTVIVDSDSALVVPSGAIGAKEANEIGQQLMNGTYSGEVKTDKNGHPYTAESFYVKGIVQSVKEYKQYNGKWEATFYLVDSPYSLNRFYCYQVYTNYPNQGEGVAQGNVVVVKCQIMCFGNTIETYNSGTVEATTWTVPVVKTVGDGSHDNPYSVADVRLMNNTQSGKAYVRGYIVGAVMDESKTLTMDNLQLANVTDKASNVVLADSPSENVAEKLIVVQLPKGAIRDAMKIGSKCPEHYGKQVLIYGNLEQWVSAPAVTNVSCAEIDGVVIQ